MSDDEMASSGDNVDDLFDSESEGECREQDESLDVSALSLTSLQAAIAHEIHEPGDRDDSASLQGASALTDQSEIVGFDLNSAAQESEVEASTEQTNSEDDAVKPDGQGFEDERAGDEDRGDVPRYEAEEGDNGDVGGDASAQEGFAVEDTRTPEQRGALPVQADAPATPNVDHNYEHEHEADHSADADDDGGNIVQEAQLDAVVATTLDMDPRVSGSEPLKNDGDRAAVNTCATAVDEPGDSPTSTCEHATEFPMADICDSGVVLAHQDDDQHDNDDSGGEDDVQLDDHEQERGVAVSPLLPAPQTAVKPQIYTVDTLFPVVYERPPPPSSLAAMSKTRNTRSSGTTTTLQGGHDPERPGDRSQSSSPPLGPRLAALQRQVEAAEHQLKSSTRAFKLQMSLTESDNKKLSQRNARLKLQLATATTDLQRSKRELAKLQAENELYAAKLPRLQAELLQESCQADETLLQSTQSQLVMTQLKARVHVLQTRNATLEKQSERLTQQLRECRQQLKRKTASLQQQTEKTSTLEGALGALKTAQSQELLAWKGRLTSALQRFELDKAKLEADWKHREQHELADARSRAEQGVKKRREAEATATRLEEKLREARRDLALAADGAQRLTKETHRLETLLRKAHRTEASLRNSVSTWKSRVRRLEDESKRRVTRQDQATRPRRPAHQIPVELLLLSDSSDDEDNQKERYCSVCLGFTPGDRSEHEFATAAPCTDCPAVQSQLQRAREELRRVRALHTAELRAHAQAFEACLPTSLEPQ